MGLSSRVWEHESAASPCPLGAQCCPCILLFWEAGMQNVIRLQYSQTGIWKTDRRRGLHKLTLIFTELERPLCRFCIHWWETLFRFVGYSWYVLAENKSGLKSEKIYITPGSEREVRHSNITFPSPRIIKFIAYHIFVLCGSHQIATQSTLKGQGHQYVV